jgi:uncharacterized protein YraI
LFFVNPFDTLCLSGIIKSKHLGMLFPPLINFFIGGFSPMKLLRNLLLSVIIGFIFSIPSAALQAAPAGTTAHTKVKILLRAKPKPTARVTATLEADVRVHVNSCAEGWCSVTVQGLTGYVLEKFLIRDMPRSPAKQDWPSKN